MTPDPVRLAAESAYRDEAPRLVAGLVRLVHDIGTAEDLAQEAIAAALEQWPADGIPTRPGAWLTAVARRRAVDHIRRERTLARKVTELGRDLTLAADAARSSPASVEAIVDEPIEDDVLRLVFITCHPVLAKPARVALALRLLGGLRTAEIARAFLTSESTVAARIVRAKRTLRERRVVFELPVGAERARRLNSVLEVVYLVFNEGYTATGGDDWLRPDLCADALRLGRLLGGLLPAEPEVHALLALMRLHAARTPARIADDGSPVLLSEQERGRWDRALADAGLASLRRARELRAPAGPYLLQAEIAACHAHAASAEQTDWARIVELYTALLRMQPSPVVALNRAVAVSMATGPAAALELVDELRADPHLRGYHLLGSVRGDLLVRLERYQEAAAEFARAAELASNARERQLLLDRAARCPGHSSG